MPVVDGMFGSDGRMLRGIHMHLMWEIQEEYSRTSENVTTSEEITASDL